ncbi:MAG: ABC transporter substrate-binding protein [Myxococcota bacterium]|nr:ABC transporter substrate-binding protein [Myxococcota bacterium]
MFNWKKLVFSWMIFSTLSCTWLLDYDECKTDQDCSGEDLVCLQGYCVAKVITPDDLRTEQCSQIYGVPIDQALAEDTILLGAILPFTGDLDVYGPKMAQGIELAVDEINQAGGILGKKIAVLSCDSGTTAEIAKQAAQHLIETVGVPAIIGPAASSVTINVFTDVAKGKGTVIMSPSATSPLLTNIQDSGYLWRTAPSDAIQGEAIAQYLLGQQGLEKIALINRNDAYGTGLRDEIFASLCEQFPCSDADRFFTRTYEETTYPSEQSQIIVDLIPFAPDITVLIGFFKDGSNFLSIAGSQGMDRFILSDGLKSDQLFDLTLASDLLCAILGTQPASPTGTIYQSFALRFRARFGPEGPYSANAYDALYLIAYAIAGTNLEVVTGANIVSGLQRLSAGQPIPAGTSQWNAACQALASSDMATIDYEGASGPLNFNPQGEAAADIEAWALNLDQNAVFSRGIIYTYDGVYQDLQFDIPGQGTECESSDMDSGTPDP